MRVPMGDRINFSRSVGIFKFSKIFRGTHADPIESHTQNVWCYIGTGMKHMEHEFYACSYGGPHELRVRPMESAWVVDLFDF